MSISDDPEFSDLTELSEEQKQQISQELLGYVTPKDKEDFARELDLKREDTRSNLANWLIWLLIGTYLFTFAFSLYVLHIQVAENGSKDIDKIYAYTKDIFSLLITTQTGLVGSVIGFYFGSNQNRN